MKPVPIAAGKSIAEKYGYDQVIIIARKAGDGGGEHCTTYGVTKSHCDVAAGIGDFLKFKVMGWVKENKAVCAHEYEPMCERDRGGEITDSWEQCVHCGAQQ
jgi:hypothetical protein